MVLSFGGECDIESSNSGWISLCKCKKSDTRLYGKHISSKKSFFFKSLIHSLSAIQKILQHIYCNPLHSEICKDEMKT
jgi:hypothetical protein